MIEIINIDKNNNTEITTLINTSLIKYITTNFSHQGKWGSLVIYFDKNDSISYMLKLSDAKKLLKVLKSKK